MSAAALSPPVAYRLGARLASEPERTWYAYSDDDFTEVCLHWAAQGSRMLATGTGLSLDAAVLDALYRANGGA